MATAAKKTSTDSSAASRELPTLQFGDAAGWLSWLERNHDRAPGLWIKLAKKASGDRSVSYDEALDGALRWGWIDGQKRSFDERAWLQKFTPRSARSVWSKINRDKALALIARGEMQSPGLAEVERAQRDGRWDAAYDSPRNAQIPADLAAALAAAPRAAEFFAKLNAANRYAILWRVQQAKREDTRKKRIDMFIAMLARREKLHS
ncbi:MAG: YdeI/OmpD-associated family protein [Polyangiales bacterium]